MSGDTFYDRSPFDDDFVDETGEPLQLDKSLLLDLLRRLAAVGSIGALRQAIDDLRRQLAGPAGPLRAGGSGDTVEFGPDYIAGKLDQIAASQTLDRALHYVERLITSIVEVRTSPINDINLNRWKEYDDILTDSLWQLDRRDSSGVHSAGYWGNFIPQIPYQMMRRYTKKGDWVLDTFAGAGTTLIEAQRLGRHSIGIELRADVAETARRLLATEPNEQEVVREVVAGDSAALDYQAILERHDRRSVQLVIMHPPYFDIIKFSDDPRDLSNAGAIDPFLERLGRVIDKAAAVLDAERYLALVIGDKYAKGEWVPLGFLAMNEVLKRDFTLKSVIVKNFEETTGKRSQKELWKYRALVGGFYIFKHEYIFVFRKRRARL